MEKRKAKSETTGRPPKYATEADLITALNAYFEYCVVKGKAPNKAGVCVHLKISRDTYSEYRKRFPDAIKGCDAMIEDWWVNRLSSNSPTGAIFYLKNAFAADYKDRQETDITSGGEKLTITGMIISKDAK